MQLFSSQPASVIAASFAKTGLVVRYTRISMISPAGRVRAPLDAERITFDGTADWRIRSLILAAGHDAGGNMRDAHSRIRSIDVLPAFAAGAVSVNADVVGFDVDLDGIVYLGCNKHAGKRSMTALGLVERRDAHQAMNSDL